MDLDRRKVLGTVGGLAIAGSGLAAFTGSAAASVSTEFKANNAGTVTTADGSVRKVMVDTSGTVSWSGLDSPADSAEVTLEAKRHGVGAAHYSEVASDTYDVNGLSGEAAFELPTVDLTEHFGDDHFESDTDGKLTATWVDLRVSVTVTSQDGSTNGANAADSMRVRSKNEASDANIDGESDASASSYDQFYQGEYYYDSDDELQIDGKLKLFIYYGRNGNVVFEVVLDEPDDAIDHLYTESGTTANVTMGFDVDADGVGDFQIAWHPEKFQSELGSDWGYSGVTSTPQWEKDTSAGWSNVPTDISVSKAGNTFTFVVPRSRLDDGGAQYKTGAYMAAGGEAPNAAVGSKDQSFWSTKNNWTSSEYYLTEELPTGSE
ncbi:hypothetical protein [Halomicrococcus gelatinilyticus]|uniref:hypothetical protein n=1 Tax=Halomicrococcus gelatinilyticus TaxID=1702103 RepID=UPI002E167FD5